MFQMYKLVGEKYGNWKCEQEMGTGGFGCVTAWKNQTNGEKMVIKQCRQKLDARNRVRWLEEIHLMNTIKHKNLVAGRSIPKEIEDAIKTPEKLLGLEYCESDLRKQLSHRTHCCGLKEKIVLNILRDVSDGLEFLHKQRIVHRDLKPENILLYYNSFENEITYKITDLGYAKMMDANSLLMSFVGTLQYLAPELYNIESGYTFTADFWSLGTLIFECITGQRPFLLTNKAFDWPKHMKSKSDDDIWGFYNESKNEVIFSSEIPSPNYLCKPLLAAFREWLKIVLRYDAKKRGTEKTPDDTLLCFAKIREILNMKIIKVFNVLEGNDISYVCKPGNNIFALKLFIYQEIGIKPENQLLVFSASGTLLNDDTPLETCCNNVDGFYLFDKDRYALYRISSVLPDKVRELVGDPEIMHKCTELRPYWAQASYYCHKKSADYIRLLQSQRALVLSIKRKLTAMERQKEQLKIGAGKLETAIDMFTLSLEYDRDSYNLQQFGDAGKQCLTEWESLNNDVYSMRKHTDHGQHEQIVNKHELEFNTLKKNPLVSDQTKSELDDISRNAGERFDKLRQKIRDLKNKDLPHDSKSMCQIVINCVTKTEELYKAFYHHLKKVMAFDCRLNNSALRLETSMRQIHDKITIAIQHQKTRQGLLWKLFSAKPNSSAPSLPNSSLPNLISMRLEESISTEDSEATTESMKEVGEALDSLDQLLGVKGKPILLKKTHNSFDDTLGSANLLSLETARPNRSFSLDNFSNKEVTYRPLRYPTQNIPYTTYAQPLSTHTTYAPPLSTHTTYAPPLSTSPYLQYTNDRMGATPGGIYNPPIHQRDGYYTSPNSAVPMHDAINMGGSTNHAQIPFGTNSHYKNMNNHKLSQPHTLQNIDHTVLQSRPVKPRDQLYQTPNDYNELMNRHPPWSSRYNERQNVDRPALTDFEIGEGQRYAAEDLGHPQKK